MAPQAKVPPHIERALITLTNKMQQCMERLDELEHRVDELAEATMNAPSHSDVMEVRMHSAKLAAELARATVELRGEIGMAGEESRRAARLARATDTGEAPFTLPVDVDITSPPQIDIGGRYDDDEDETGDRKGWSASA